MQVCSVSEFHFHEKETAAADPKCNLAFCNPLFSIGYLKYESICNNPGAKTRQVPHKCEILNSAHNSDMVKVSLGLATKHLVKVEGR